MIDDWAPEGARNINTLRSHPNAFTIRNRKRQRTENTILKKKDVKFNFEVAADRLKPWKSDLELIEGKCGSAITSYFIFIRRLITLNLFLSLISFAGIIIPYFVTKKLDEHKVVNKEDKNCTYPNIVIGASFLTNLQLIVSGQGALEYTPLFYGYYEPTETSPTAYNVSIWYLVTIFVIFLSSLIMISIRAGRGIEKEIVGKSGQIFKYSKIILSGWDCNISDQQTAILKKRLRTMQIKYELKEDQLLSEREAWSFWEWTWVYFIRFITTILNLLITVLSILAIVLASTKGQNLHSENTFYQFILSYLVSITMGGTSLIAPIFYKCFTAIQRHRSETRINQVIGWRVALRFLSLIALFLSLFYKILQIGNCDENNIFLETLQNANLTKIFRKLTPEEDSECSIPCSNRLDVCWPVVLGQECFKLTIGWLLGQLGTILFMAAPTRFFWNYFKYRIPLISTFDITDNVLKIVSWQTVVWLSAFYCPFMPFLVFIVQLIVFYVNRVAVLYLYLPDEDNHYKSSTEGNFFTILLVIGFYLGGLLTMAAIIILPPSLFCGPFQEFKEFTEPFENLIHDPGVLKAWKLLSSKTVMYTIIVIAFAFCYFYQVKSTGLAERIRILELQLKKEEEDQKFVFKQRTQHHNSRLDISRLSNQPRTIIERADAHRNSALYSRDGQSAQNSNLNQRTENSDAHRNSALYARDGQSARSSSQNLNLRTENQISERLPKRKNKLKQSVISWT